MFSGVVWVRLCCGCGISKPLRFRDLSDALFLKLDAYYYNLAVTSHQLKL